MNPGRELDALVAEKVMGWKKLYKKDYPQSGDWCGLDWMWDKKESALFTDAQHVPNYSTAIAAAWEVVEKILSLEKGSSYQVGKCEPFGRLHYCDFTLWIDAPGGGYKQFLGKANTISHAICLAALKAVGVKIDE